MIVSQWPGTFQIRENPSFEYRGEIVNMYPADECGSTRRLAFFQPDVYTSARSINCRRTDYQGRPPSGSEPVFFLNPASAFLAGCLNRSGRIYLGLIAVNGSRRNVDYPTWRQSGYKVSNYAGFGIRKRGNRMDQNGRLWQFRRQLRNSQSGNREVFKTFGLTHRGTDGDSPDQQTVREASGGIPQAEQYNGAVSVFTPYGVW